MEEEKKFPNKNKCKCPNDKKFYEEEYIKKKKSVKEISLEFGIALSSIYKRLKFFNLTKSRIGKENKMWKGNKVKYNALHDWIKKHKPKSMFCECCGKVTDKLEVANISGLYKRDISDFRWLCRSCHMKMDYSNKIRIGKGKNGKNK